MLDRLFTFILNPLSGRITTALAMPNSHQSMEDSVKRDFVEFVSFCKKQNFSPIELDEICAPLIWRQHVQRLQRAFLAVIALLLCGLAIYCGCWDWISWTSSAIARLLLIQLLPYWNWTSLYEARCLIERSVDTDQSLPSSAAPLGRYETDPDNCVLCATLDRIPTAHNVTYSFLEANFLERGLPVIVTDSHRPQSLDDLLKVLLAKALDFLDSEPCDLFTNLMLKKRFSVRQSLMKILTLSPTDPWFLQLRNCRFKAVKSSRLFVTRPYYYPLHLEPFYSSWLLLAHNHNIPDKELYLQGLVFVQQLSGTFDMQLRPKQPCEDMCPVLNIRLEAGECLVFSTDLWLLSYGNELANPEANSTIATILEIDWSL